MRNSKRRGGDLLLRCRDRDLAAETIVPPVKHGGAAYLLNQRVHHTATDAPSRRWCDQWAATFSPADRKCVVGRSRPRQLNSTLTAIARSWSIAKNQHGRLVARRRT